MDLLLKKGAAPNLGDFKNRTPLMSAAYRGKVNIVRKLLEIKIVKDNINAQDKDGNTALIFAAKRGHGDIVDLLFTNGADPNLGNFKHRTPLMIAISRGKMNIVEKLLEILAVKDNINDQDKNGNTALIFAAKEGDEGILDSLLKNGADPNLSSFRERTPLMSAVVRGKINIVRKLLEIQTVKDNINATDKEGDTALSLANREGYKEIADLLQANGAIHQPVKEVFLNMKRAFKRMFLLKKLEKKINCGKRCRIKRGGNPFPIFFRKNKILFQKPVLIHKLS